MLYAMHYFMSRMIIFTKDSAEKAVERIRRPHKLNFAQILTSTLLNLQIKQAMQGLLLETTEAVLSGLDGKISGRKKADWADNFCVILILCMCIEAVQVASDSHAMAALRKDSKCGLSRINICRLLDEKPFKHLAEIFHMCYNTKRANLKSHVGLNPIRNGLRVDLVEGITPQMVKLVNDVKAIMNTYGKDISREVWYSNANNFSRRYVWGSREYYLRFHYGPPHTPYGFPEEKFRQTCVEVLEVFYREDMILR